jgi:hypothetical protein
MAVHAIPWLASFALAVSGAVVAAGPAATPVMPADHPKISPPPAPAERLDPATVMARVDQETITAADLDAAIAAMPSPDRFEYVAPEALRDLLEALIDRKLMARLARRDGLVPATAEAWLARELGKVPAPTDAAVERYYREHRTGFTVPKRVRVTRAVAKSAAAANRLREDLARGATAAELRTRHATDLSGLDEGLWLQDAAKKPELVAVALELKAGQTSRVVALEAGFAVMRAEEVAAGSVRPLTEVRAGIVASIEEADRAAALDGARRKLRTGPRIEVMDAALLSYLPPPPGPAAGPSR